ncbi:hypothetical protein LINPERHAP1_LOCUS8121 [Linum perenne]
MLARVETVSFVHSQICRLQSQIRLRPPLEMVASSYRGYIGEVNPSARFRFSRLQHRRGKPIGEVPLLSTAASTILIPHSTSGFRFSPSPSARNLVGAAALPQKYIIIADPDPDFATGQSSSIAK